MTAKEILQLIESVSPDDTEKMDEINNLVEQYIGGNLLLEWARMSLYGINGRMNVWM